MTQKRKSLNPAENQEKFYEINQLFDKLNDKDRLTSSVNTKPQTVDEIANKWKINNKIMDLFAKKIEKDTSLKGKYALALIIILIVQLILLNIWFVLKGLGTLSFADSTFNIFITGGLAEVFALVGIIVKYLFNDNLSELLKLIIRVTNINSNNNSKNKKN